MFNFLDSKKHIHFIGIGGSGMYPLAQILNGNGYNLTGSDNNMTETLAAVKAMGIPVFLGHKASNIAGADLIIYSAAIAEDNPELKAARKAGVETRERAELLGLITSFYERAICVCGTHGKTTVTSMLAHIFLAENVDISAVIGGKLKLIGGSGRIGKSDTMICEACEFNDTFLKLNPNIAVVLNIDDDHMDYFKTMDNLISSFTKFCSMSTDMIIYNGDDPNCVKAVNAVKEVNGKTPKKISFGKREENTFHPLYVKRRGDFETSFRLMKDGISWVEVTLRVPGGHNVWNAVAAGAVAVSCGCSQAAIQKGLESFTGAGRRFERLYEKNGITVADDYAHHPLEVVAVLEAAKRMSYKRIIAIHQPFTYSRTAALLCEFAEALSMADEVILTPIMGGREENTYGVTVNDLAAKINGATIIDTFEGIAAHIKEKAAPGDLIITLGCGDIDKAAKLIVEQLTVDN
ncbi:MAG: UDP-N-acetylmuramate--L-alanine ligase [Oscillospiraceae bacterium]|nr:UDP-N-acetylmuramate--L-alanine ligase [Oscillospiraceae bacterium]